MPITNQEIGQTSPKTGTYQRTAKRMDGVELKIPSAAGVSVVTNNRIVSLQQDLELNVYAVISPVALSDHIIIGWGVIEESLQSGGLGVIAPNPNEYRDGDSVTVLRSPYDVYAIDFDPSNEPTDGIGTAYLDVQGRLSSVSGGSNLALEGSVFSGIPAREMGNQLKDGCKFYQMQSPVVP
jgi:hypothetical protein